MARIFPVSIYARNDYEENPEWHSLGSGYVGIASGQVLTENLGEIQGNYDAFTDRLSNGTEYLGLGFSATKPAEISFDMPWSRFFPLCTVRENQWQLANYDVADIKYVFESGDYVISTTYGITGVWANGTQAWQYYSGEMQPGVAWTTWSYYSSSFACTTFVVSDMDNEGVIPDGAEYASYRLYWDIGEPSLVGEIVNLGEQAAMTLFFNTQSGVSPSHDPYATTPESGMNGGGGVGIGGVGGDVIDEPDLPTTSVIDTGLVTLYNPTASRLTDFAQWLWDSNGLDLDTLKRVFNDPMDMILGLSIIPAPIPTSGTLPITLGNITSPVSAPVVSQQFVRIDCGSIRVERIYNSYLDYAPYTKAQIFLPYVGIRELNIDEIMNKTVHVTYSVDLLTGSCVAHIMVNGSLMYEFGGSCIVQIPIAGRDFSAVVQGLVGAAASGLMAIAGAAGAKATLPAALAGTSAGSAVVASASASGIAGMARETVASKPAIQHASGISSTAGYLSSQRPYLIVERPNLCRPAHQEHFTGYPGFIYSTVGDLSSGFVKFVNIEIINVHATDGELDEIIDWFMNKGVRV